MSFVHRIVVVLAASLSVGSVACVIGEEHHEIIYYDAHQTSSTLTCKTDDFQKVDVKSLKACGKDRGHGHCYDRMKVHGIGGPHDPSGDNDYEDSACEDTEICVPDKILEANGKKLQACKWGAGGDGVCMSKIAKRINDNAAALKQGECEGDDEVCTPCKDPTAGNADTHTCDAMGVHGDACVGGKGASGVSLCCNGLGLCTEKEGIPGGNADSLPKDSCQKESQVCAPAALIDNKPQKCELPGGFDGVCLPYCFADQLQGAKAAIRSTCNALSFCLPCAIGKSQGMPGCE